METILRLIADGRANARPSIAMALAIDADVVDDILFHCEKNGWISRSPCCASCPFASGACQSFIITEYGRRQLCR
ncbi:MAG: hypothetical protein LBG86_00700 [Puniceicoccales bacterium]|nr:hypothetical protein [Puniceicoccales bacterium]